MFSKTSIRVIICCEKIIEYHLLPYSEHKIEGEWQQTAVFHMKDRFHPYRPQTTNNEKLQNITENGCRAQYGCGSGWETDPCLCMFRPTDLCQKNVCFLFLWSPPEATDSEDVFMSRFVRSCRLLWHNLLHILSILRPWASPVQQVFCCMGHQVVVRPWLRKQWQTRQERTSFQSRCL